MLRFGLIIGLTSVLACTSSGGGSLGAQPTYVQTSPFTRLVIHADFGPDMVPPDGVLSAVQDAIQSLIQKPDGVSVVLGSELSNAAQAKDWTIEELDAFYDQTAATTRNDSQTQHIYTLFLDGNLAEPTAAGGLRLGHAWGGNRAVIFRQTLLDLCQSLTFQSNEAVNRKVACQIAGTEVWVHELGHLLGLVDNGLPMQTPHRDLEHGKHDSDTNCVMYWSTETELLMDKIRDRIEAGKDNVNWFCEQCQADVKAAQQPIPL